MDEIFEMFLIIQNYDIRDNITMSSLRTGAWSGTDTLANYNKVENDKI